MSDIETTITQLAEESAQSYLEDNLESEVEDKVESYMNDNFQTDEYVTQESLHHEISELQTKIEDLTNEIKEIKNATTSDS
mgnify:FL=1|jgi:polyhydroxyalkanoate synthesis regulator phasin|tara:strand:- start:856 stop:1098 length:243 start_codon:yes stop_codon:yes gene_type:complete